MCETRCDVALREVAPPAETQLIAVLTVICVCAQKVAKAILKRVTSISKRDDGPLERVAVRRRVAALERSSARAGRAQPQSRRGVLQLQLGHTARRGGASERDAHTAEILCRAHSHLCEQPRGRRDGDTLNDTLGAAIAAAAVRVRGGAVMMVVTVVITVVVRHFQSQIALERGLRCK